MPKVTVQPYVAIVDAKYGGIGMTVVKDHSVGSASKAVEKLYNESQNAAVILWIGSEELFRKILVRALLRGR